MTQVLDFFGSGSVPPLWGDPQTLLTDAPLAASTGGFDYTAQVADWLGMNVECLINSGNNCKILLTWYSSDPKNPNVPAVYMGQSVWDLRAGVTLVFTAVNKGPYVNLSILPDSSGGGIANVSLILQYTNDITVGVPQLFSPLRLDLPGTPITAGATLTLPVNTAYAGRCFLHFATDSPTWTFAVQATITGGVPSFPVFAADQGSVLGGKRIDQEIFLPPSILDLVVHNGDVADHTYEATLTPLTYAY